MMGFRSMKDIDADPMDSKEGYACPKVLCHVLL